MVGPKKKDTNMAPEAFRTHSHLKVISRTEIFVYVKLLERRIDAHIIVYRSVIRRYVSVSVSNLVYHRYLYHDVPHNEV